MYGSFISPGNGARNPDLNAYNLLPEQNKQNIKRKKKPGIARDHARDHFLLTNPRQWTRKVQNIKLVNKIASFNTLDLFCFFVPSPRKEP